MPEFDRIIREALVMGGQARIRDTNITVNEIVRLSLAGTSQADILAQYPQLEAEDVHQALGYGMKDVSEHFDFFRTEILTPLDSVRGYSEFLANPEKLSVRKHSDEWKNFIEKAPKIIHLSALQTIARILDLTTWFALLYRPYLSVEYLEMFSARTLVEEIEDNLLRHQGMRQKNVVINDPQDDYRINAHHLLWLALIYLLLEGSDAVLNIIYENQILQFIVSVKIPPNPNWEYYFQFGTLLSANVIIYQSGSELKVKQEGDSVIFKFALPIVDEDEN